MLYRRAVEEMERGLALRRSEGGLAHWVVAREFTGASVYLKSPVRPDLIEGDPVELLDLLPENACAGVEDGFGGRRGEASSGDSGPAEIRPNLAG